MLTENLNDFEVCMKTKLLKEKFCYFLSYSGILIRDHKPWALEKIPAPGPEKYGKFPTGVPTFKMLKKTPELEFMGGRYKTTLLLNLISKCQIN